MMVSKKVIAVITLLLVGLMIFGCSEQSLPEPPALPEDLTEENVNNNLNLEDIPPPPPLPG